MYLVEKYNEKQKAFFAILEEMDQDVWHSTDDAIKHHLRSMKFFRNKEYLALDDDHLNELARELHKLNRVGTLAVLAGIGFGLAFSLVHGGVL